MQITDTKSMFEWEKFLFTSTVKSTKMMRETKLLNLPCPMHRSRISSFCRLMMMAGRCAAAAAAAAAAAVGMPHAILAFAYDFLQDRHP